MNKTQKIEVGMELLRILAGQVRHRAQHALAPQQRVREGRNVAHVDAAAYDGRARRRRA